MSLILNDGELFEEWKRDIRTMAGRIVEMRQALYEQLLETPGNWEHIRKQIGMFSFTGLNREQSRQMTDTWHIYLTSNGRISMAGLNSKNVEYVGSSIDAVIRHSKL